MLIPFIKKKYNFKPGLFLSFFFFAIVILFTWLGFWQLDRADEKKVMSEQIFERQAKNIFSLNEKSIEQLQKKDMSYRNIEVSGQFEVNDQFYVDNKKYQGQIGYHVITPFRIKGSNQIILVNRGWVSSGGSRKVLPEVVTPENVVKLSGQLQKPVNALFRPGISKPSEQLGGIWLYIDLTFFSTLSDYVVIPYILRLNPDNAYGFICNWSKFKANTQMHIGYAIQWFAFAFFSMLAYVAIGLEQTKE